MNAQTRKDAFAEECQTCEHDNCSDIACNKCDTNQSPKDYPWCGCEKEPGKNETKCRYYRRKVK